MERWVATEFVKKDRPKTLVLWGPSKLGKTEWARALNHIIAERNGVTDPDLISKFLVSLAILLVADTSS
jgi:replication-associated recombination protein RarA